MYLARTPLDLTISGKCYLLGYWEEQWLKDCLGRYEAQIDSLEKLHEVCAWSCMDELSRSEVVAGASKGGIVWMPSEFWDDD